MNSGLISCEKNLVSYHAVKYNGRFFLLIESVLPEIGVTGGNRIHQTTASQAEVTYQELPPSQSAAFEHTLRLECGLKLLRDLTFDCDPVGSPSDFQILLQNRFLVKNYFKVSLLRRP